MRYLAKQYGDIVEITEIEKDKSATHRISYRKGSKIKIRLPNSKVCKDVPFFEYRRLDSIKRTKQIFMRRMLSALKKFGCPLLLDLTFQGDSSDASFANDSLRRFQVRLRTKFDNPQSIFVPELSPRGRIHFHGLLFNVPLSLGDTRVHKRTIVVGEERNTRILAGLWGKGFVDAQQTDGSSGLAYYITGYITKSGGETLFNCMRLLRTSHGFPKETIYRGVVAKKIYRHYDKTKTPFWKFEWDDQFQGKMKKKRYDLSR